MSPSMGSVRIIGDRGMIDCNFTGPADARPGDVLFWGRRSAPPGLLGRGKVLRVELSLPTVRVVFDGQVTGLEGEDTDTVVFDQSEVLGVVRPYPAGP